ncbi:MAG: recombinase family protein [Bosea sp. (in: a-proteobacteria)]
MKHGELLQAAGFANRWCCVGRRLAWRCQRAVSQPSKQREFVQMIASLSVFTTGSQQEPRHACSTAAARPHRLAHVRATGRSPFSQHISPVWMRIALVRMLCLDLTQRHGRLMMAKEPAKKATKGTANATAKKTVKKPAKKAEAKVRQPAGPYNKLPRKKPKTFGYLRVAADNHDIALFRKMLKAQKIDTLFEDVPDPNSSARPQLGAMIENLRPDDTGVMVRLNHLSARSADTLYLLREIAKEAVHIRLISNAWQQLTPTSALVMDILSHIPPTALGLSGEGGDGGSGNGGP